VAAGGAGALLPAVVGGRQPAPPAGVPLVPLLDPPQQPREDGGGACPGRLMFDVLPACAVTYRAQTGHLRLPCSEHCRLRRRGCSLISLMSGPSCTSSALHPESRLRLRRLACNLKPNP